MIVPNSPSTVNSVSSEAVLITSEEATEGVNTSRFTIAWGEGEGGGDNSTHYEAIFFCISMLFFLFFFVLFLYVAQL